MEVIYLNELGAMAELTPGLGILRLLIEPVETVPEAARGLIERVQQGSRSAVDTARLIELIETIVCTHFRAGRGRRSRQC
ncbi:MAG: DUF2887 domain-containing protein [Leptolyngbya sp. SIOISBB]|nr:DUF2887 domain-containing protein [Leptolyngbya sp. SIOISBB]